MVLFNYCETVLCPKRFFLLGEQNLQTKNINIYNGDYQMLRCY